MSTVDDIKAKIDLADYLREQGVQLQQVGASLKARCPFHNEKTPSFMVSREKQVYYCFGCSRGGDLFTFVQEREGFEFGEALRLLAERAGVQLEARDPRLEGKKTRALAVLELAAKWFRHQLEKTAGGDVARAYIARRGVVSAIAEQFQIGYAPDAWDELSRFLAQRGFAAQEAVEAGLCIPSQRGATRVYDRFRHRLMFPIHDAMGRVVGFTGRILEGGKTTGPAGETVAKYVNTPETALYKKGAILYGLVFAREAIRTSGYVVLVEGQMDVIACHGAGVANTVAASGTALTMDQLRLLKRSTATIHVAFDADPAGEGAAERGIDAALDAGFDVRVIRMPTEASGHPIAKDADECIQKDAEAWRQAVAHPIPVLDSFTERVQRRCNLRDPAGQRDAGRVLVGHLAHVADPIERAAWLRRIAQTIGVPEDAIRSSLSRLAAVRAPDQPPAATAPSSSAAAVDHLADRFLALCIRYPDVAATTVTSVPMEAFREERQTLYQALVAQYAGGTAPPREVDRMTETGFVGSIERLGFLADREFGSLSPEEVVQEITRCGQLLRRRVVTQELHDIAARLRTIERASGERSDEVRKLEERTRVLNDTLAMIP